MAQARDRLNSLSRRFGIAYSWDSLSYMHVVGGRSFACPHNAIDYFYTLARTKGFNV